MARDEQALEFYLSHAAYVRRLARHLVFDQHRADDLEQQTWLAALENPPRHSSSPRGWLKVLARNLARKTIQAEVRRGDRERDVAREYAGVPTPEEIQEREEARRGVVESLLAMEDPYRTVLVLRYLEGLSSSGVAKRLGRPVETVKTQTKRGLERLRKRLGREDGFGTAWGLLLVRQLRLEPPSARILLRYITGVLCKGVTIMDNASKVALGAVALLTVGVGFYLTFGAPQAGRSQPAGSAPGEAAAHATVAASSGERSAEPLLGDPISPEGSSVRHAVQSGSEPVSVSEASADLVVQLEWWDRQPAADVSLRILPLGQANANARATAVRTDEAGRALIANLAPGAVAVEPDRGGYGTARLLAGEITDLKIVIPRGFDVEGRVIDPLDRPVAGAEILLWRPFRPAFELARVATTDNQGNFRLRSVDPSRSAVLCARANGFLSSRQTELEGVEGGLRRITLQLAEAGATLEGRVLDSEGRPLAQVRVLVGSEDGFGPRVEKDGSTSQPAVGRLVRTDSEGRFKPIPVPLGTVDVRAQADGFAVQHTQVETRSRSYVELMLLPGAGVRGIIRDTEGRPLEGVVVHTPRFQLNSRRAISAADGSYCLTDVSIGEVRVIADGGRRGRVHTTLTTIEGQEEIWNVTLADQPAIQGIVTAAGVAKEGWNIWITPLEGRRAGAERRFGISDDQGAFVFGSLPPVAYRLSAGPPGKIVVEVCHAEPVFPGEEVQRLEMDPRLRPSVRIVGRVLGKGRVLKSGARIRLEHPGLAHAQPLLTDPTTGWLSIGPLPPGHWGLTIDAPGFDALTLDPRDLLAGELWDLGAIDLPPAPVAR